MRRRRRQAGRPPTHPLDARPFFEPTWLQRGTHSISLLPQGVEIDSVDSRADASTQGLQAGDVITAVNGTAITTMDEINSIKEDMQAGDKLTLTIYRPSAQKSMDVTITLTDAHDLEGTDPAQQQQQQQQQQDQNNYGNYGSYGNGGYVDPFQYFFGY